MSWFCDAICVSNVPFKNYLDTVNGNFANQVEYFVKAADYFTSSELGRKRDILKYVFQNLQLEGKKSLEYTIVFLFLENGFPFLRIRKMQQNWKMEPPSERIQNLH
jgi:hypothetical protein